MNKWSVRRWNGVWGIYEPGRTWPLDSEADHACAMEVARRYAIFDELVNGHLNMEVD
ncbi:hypothetical protein PBI_GAIA_78 [Mycobacterium phage Gaia]|uniref:Uncharacterized protein n=1 Tax=Mycobacterium phage Gaia TaxID=1486472 RepID=A0A068F1S3_9CAUD|nr:hypothetical protein VC46_gp155 [Mycobacterium phage Gaia]AID58897.1 hypothetical protein PBI_GAIA_78 [Mycobacterium phage Gaia]AYR00016.1 hypothetical protein PBI_NEBKISS_77 [Mycobacterium phage Nebkiss]